MGSWRHGVESFARRARKRALYALPERWRSRLRRVLPAGLLLPEWRGRSYWDAFYGGADRDPFGLDRLPEERAKFEAALQLCGPGPFQRALEIGCSVGTFTELLAPRCGSLLATDISSQAAATARKRLVGIDHVRIDARDVTVDFPEGTFDLIVASDVLYYWTPEENLRVLRAVEAALRPGGAFVLLHYAPRMGSLLNGSEVHDLITAETALEHAVAETREFGDGRFYRVDSFRRAPDLADALLDETRSRHALAALAGGNSRAHPR